MLAESSRLCRRTGLGFSTRVVCQDVSGGFCLGLQRICLQSTETGTGCVPSTSAALPFLLSPLPSLPPDFPGKDLIQCGLTERYTITFKTLTQYRNVCLCVF